MTTQNDSTDVRRPVPDTSDLPRLRRRSDGTEYPLDGETVVGRGLECDIVISDGDSISRRHAQLTGDADGLFVADLGSTNGTHVNGREVTERTALRDGDVVAFDEFEFEVVMPPPPAPPAPEVTRVVSREEVLARIGGDDGHVPLPDTGEDGRDPVPSDAAVADGSDRVDPAAGGRPQAASPEGDAAADGAPDLSAPAHASPLPDADPHASERDDDRAAGEPRDVVDAMGEDEWSWPQLDDELDEPVIELADGPSEPPVGSVDAGTAGDESPAVEMPVAEEPDLGSPDFGSPGDDPIGHGPRDAAPLDVDATGRRAPEPAASPASAPPEERRNDPEPPDRGPVDAPRTEVHRPAPVPPAAPPPPPRAEPVADVAASAGADRAEAAPLPGAWANDPAVQGAAGHTVIVKYVAPQRMTPPEVDPERLDGPTLVVGTEDPGGELLLLDGDGPEWIIGSGDGADLRIRDEGVSVRHAVISHENNKWRLCDELSANGTYVNGNRVNVGYVGDGDVLRFGPVECRLAIPRSARAKRGAPARGRAAVPGGRAPAARPGGGFPWKVVGLLAGALLVALVAVAATAFFLTSRG